MYIHMDIDGYDLLNVRHILYSGIFMKSVAKEYLQDRGRFA